VDEQLIRSYQRWRQAEESAREDEADAAFAGVFRSATREHVVSAGFTAETMEAVAAAAARDLRRARRTRRVLVPIGAIALVSVGYASAGLVAAALSSMVVRLLDVMVAAVVTVATTVTAGTDAWTVVTSLGRAVGALIANPAVTATVLTIQGFAIVALLALQRLLRSDRESFR
jgi:hypothetical protein